MHIEDQLKLGQDITVTLKGSAVKSEMGDNQDGKVNLNSEAIRKLHHHTLFFC